MTGDILSIDYGIIVHQVNAQGVMGSGVAKEIRERYPQVFHDYIQTVGYPYTQKDNGKHFLGNVVWTKVNSGLWIASLVGQQFFGRDERKRYTSYDALDTGFERVAMAAKMYNLPVYYPLIGCGLGGAKWKIVQAIIDERLGDIKHELVELPS